ncbi:hypothetical protein PoB_006064200 [Plakobranchus ocellatus]|uniref:Uncharacterized protein n=1 Tax=Plakobranchus ocellatus TaxID=259542 RepID=A0AAV4CQI2_9GAST|nr:hypothetical protein PoB_006064200 [Plakobranchus ocellatus]
MGTATTSRMGDALRALSLETIAKPGAYGWPNTAVCHLCAEREETLPRVFFFQMSGIGQHPSLGMGFQVPEPSLWRQDRVTMSTAADMLRLFLRRAMQFGWRPGSGAYTQIRTASISRESRATLSTPLGYIQL